MQIQLTHWQPFSAFTSSVAVWKSELGLLFDTGMVKLWPYSTMTQRGPAAGEEINDRGGQNVFLLLLSFFFYPRAR